MEDIDLQQHVQYFSIEQSERPHSATAMNHVFSIKLTVELINAMQNTSNCLPLLELRSKDSGEIIVGLEKFQFKLISEGIKECYQLHPQNSLQLVGSINSKILVKNTENTLPLNMKQKTEIAKELASKRKSIPISNAEVNLQPILTKSPKLQSFKDISDARFSNNNINSHATTHRNEINNKKDKKQISNWVVVHDFPSYLDANSFISIFFKGLHISHLQNLLITPSQHSSSKQHYSEIELRSPHPSIDLYIPFTSPEGAELALLRNGESYTPPVPISHTVTDTIQQQQQQQQQPYNFPSSIESTTTTLNIQLDPVNLDCEPWIMALGLPLLSLDNDINSVIYDDMNQRSISIQQQLTQITHFIPDEFLFFDPFVFINNWSHLSSMGQYLPLVMTDPSSSKAFKIADSDPILFSTFYGNDSTITRDSEDILQYRKISSSQDDSSSDLDNMSEMIDYLFQIDCYLRLKHCFSFESPIVENDTTAVDLNWRLLSLKFIKKLLRFFVILKQSILNDNKQHARK